MDVQVLLAIIRLRARVENRQVSLTLVMLMTHAIKHAAVQESQNVMHNFLVTLPQFAHRLVVTVRILVTIGETITLVRLYYGAKLHGKTIKYWRVHVATATENITFSLN